MNSPNSSKRNSSRNIPGRGGTVGKLRSAALAQDVPIGRICRLLFTGLAAAILAGATMFGRTRPFGLAMIASASGFSMALSAFLGTVIGSVAAPDFTAVSAAASLLLCARILVGVLLGGQWRQSGDTPAGNRAAPPPAASPEDKSTSGFFGGQVAFLRFVPRLRADTGPAGAQMWMRGAACESVWLRAAFGAAAAMLSCMLSALTLPDTSPFSLSVLLESALSVIAVPLAALAFTTVTESRLARTPWRDVGQAVFLFALVRALRDARGIPFNAGTVCAFAVSVLAAGAGIGRDKRVSLPDSRRIVGGVLWGVVAGLAMDPGGAPLYAAAAMTAGLLMRHSPGAAVCGAWISAAAIAYCDGGLVSFAAVVPEITLTAAVLIPLLHFRLLPAAVNPRGEGASALRQASRDAAGETAYVASAQAREHGERMRSLSRSMERMSGMMSAVAERMRRPGILELKELCDETCRAHCTSCKNRVLCWEREYATTADTVCRMAHELHRSGRVSAAVVPPNLAGRCVEMDRILDEINDGCARRAEAARLTDRSDVFAEGFSSFSALLAESARETEAKFAPDEELSRKLRRALRYRDFYADEVTVYGDRRRLVVARNLDLSRVRMGGEEIRALFEEETGAAFGDPEYQLDGESVSMTLTGVPSVRTRDGACSRGALEEPEGGRRGRGKKAPPNGDCAVRFETEDGRYYMLICDGMGTGGEASFTAQLAAGFLTEMLSGGASMATALTMLNQYMRSRKLECSTGIDLMEIDRYTGEARFVKSGAAPSFVVRDGRLFRLSSKTVPIGILRALDAEMIRFRLTGGDVIVMLSDGVTENFEECAWLCDMLASPAVMDQPPEEIARRIVRAAGAQSGRHRDDITAAVVKIA